MLMKRRRMYVFGGVEALAVLPDADHVQRG